MKERLGQYDASTQMFVEPVHEPDPNHLLFLKRLVSEGKFEDDLRADIVVFKPKEPQEVVVGEGDY